MSLSLWAALASAGDATLWAARYDLPEGHVLRASDLTELRVADVDIPLGAVLDPTTVAGRTVKVPMFVGELVRGEYLGPAVSAPPVEVPVDWVALAVPVATDASELDLVVLRAGGFCTAVPNVLRIGHGRDLIAVPAGQLAAALRAVAQDASVRRSDPGQRPCR